MLAQLGRLVRAGRAGTTLLQNTTALPTLSLSRISRREAPEIVEKDVVPGSDHSGFQQSVGGNLTRDFSGEG